MKIFVMLFGLFLVLALVSPAYLDRPRPVLSSAGTMSALVYDDVVYYLEPDGQEMLFVIRSGLQELASAFAIIDEAPIYKISADRRHWQWIVRRRRGDWFRPSGDWEILPPRLWPVIQMVMEKGRQEVKQRQDDERRFNQTIRMLGK